MIVLLIVLLICPAVRADEACYPFGFSLSDQWSRCEQQVAADNSVGEISHCWVEYFSGFDPRPYCVVVDYQNVTNGNTNINTWSCCSSVPYPNPYPPTSLDLGLENLQISQSGAIINPGDGNLQIRPALPLQVVVAVIGSGFNSTETRTTTVTLKSGDQPIQWQTVNLADIQAAGGTLKVTFTVNFDPKLLGSKQAISATVDPDDQLGETNTSNNSATAQVDLAVLLDVPYVSQHNDCLPPEPPLSAYLNGITQSSGATTISKKGCALAALDMALLFDKTGNSDICQLNSTLTGTKAFQTKGISIKFDSATALVTSGANYFVPSYSNDPNTLKSILLQGTPAIVKVVGAGAGSPGSSNYPFDGNATSGVHFIVVRGATANGDFNVRDPNSNNNVLLSQFTKKFGDGSQFYTRGILFPPPSTNRRRAVDPSHLTLAGLNAQLLVRDAQGRRTGYDSSRGMILNEIPGSNYSVDAIEDDETGDPASEFTSQVYLPASENQTYNVQIVSDKSGPVEIESDSFDAGGQISASATSLLEVAQGSPVTISINENGSVNPVLQPPSKGFVEIDQGQPMFQEGVQAWGLVWIRVWPTSPDVKVSLEAYLDGTGFDLIKLNQDLYQYELPRLSPGIHELRIKGYIGGDEVDNAISYVDVLPGSRGGREK